MSDGHEKHQPEVLEAYWEREQVLALLSDLDRHAEVERVQVRRAAAGGGPRTGSVSLQQARELLDDESTRALQIYYRFDGDSWCDTLMLAPDKIHVVRTKVPADR